MNARKIYRLKFHSAAIYNLEMDSVIIALIVVIVIVMIFIKAGGRRKKVLSNFDGEHYEVLASYEDSDEAAHLIAQVNEKMIEFFAYLKSKYKINHVESVESNLTSGEYDYSKDPELINIVQRILTRYDPEKLMENKPLGKTESTYTVNKGDKMMVCLRQRDNGKLCDYNDLIFVILHEISHIGNARWGHDIEFWEIFKFILHEAKLSGIHKSANYAKNPSMYCGQSIKYNPLYDDTLANIWEKGVDLTGEIQY